jgi:hypothetical protein
MEIQLTKIEAATEQIDWAIRLFIDHQACLPAITLAGAAEEIVGAALADRSAFSQLKVSLSTQFDLPVSVISQGHLNNAKNWLKHWKEANDSVHMSIDIENEAIQYVVRALTNLALYDGTTPSEGPRFIDWLLANKPDLAEHRFVLSYLAGR